MKREVELDLLDRALLGLHDTTLSPGQSDSSVEVERYLSPDWYRAERDRLFSRLPNMLVHGSELPEPHSFVTLEHFGRDLLVTRNAEGRARVFLNVCRHRGALLETAERGQKKRFVCGYHAWSYDSDGRLRAIPNAHCFPSVRPGCRNLVELCAVEAYGFIWLMPEPGQGEAELAAFLGGLTDDLADLDLGAFEVFGFESHVWEINWKLVIEGTLESYHFSTLHPKSAHTLFENNGFFFDRFGPHLRSVLPKRSIRLLDRKAREDWKLVTVANVIHTIFPNETVLHQSDHFLWITAHPLGPERTRVKLRLLVPKPPAQGDGTAAWEANRQFTYQVQYEDLEIFRRIQRGLRSGANREHLFGTLEAALVAYNDSLERYLAADDSQSRTRPEDGAGGPPGAEPRGG